MDFFKIICTLAFICSPKIDANIKHKEDLPAKNQEALYKPINIDLSSLTKWTKVIKAESAKPTAKKSN